MDTPTARTLREQTRHILAHIHREFPTWNAQRLNSVTDLSTPRQRHPLFFGSYDWHSNVHSHWALLRYLNMPRAHDSGSLTAAVSAALEESFANRAAIEVETRYWSAGMGQQMPYGAAWLLKLCTELRGCEHPQAHAWRRNLHELETCIGGYARQWVRGLTVPDRSGQHFNSAWSLLLVHEWADATGAHDLASEVGERVWNLFSSDRNAPVLYEPSAHDFLSPTLAEAAAICHTQPVVRTETWLRGFFPQWFTGDPPQVGLPVPQVDDVEDYRRAHLAGLPFTRAVSFHHIAQHLHAHQILPRIAQAVHDEAHRELQCGLQGTTSDHYSTGHWVSSYIVYALTEISEVPIGQRVAG